MNLLKKLSLAVAAIAFFLSLSVVTGNAQGRSGWKNNNGQNRGRINGQRNGWNRGQKRGWRNNTVILTQSDRNWRRNDDRSWRNRQYRSGRLTANELRQLQRRRALLNRTRNRYYSDGYLSNSERRRLNKRYSKYQQRVRRDRRDW